jgi:putative Mg2+ transporter-C (MgtC) family protein
MVVQSAATRREKSVMTTSIGQAAMALGVAVTLGGLIGFERQWRNRLAGLRTNALVALGSATFVVFEALMPGDPTRVAAQVVSGIGFIGAGLIFREGLSVRGLNTAATLWCSAAVGVLAGAGFPAYAGLATGFVVFVNLLLRPIVRFINQQPLSSSELEIGYLVSVTCRNQDEAHIRALLLQNLVGARLALRRLESNDLSGTGLVAVAAVATAPQRVDTEVERIVGRLSLEPTISGARWQADVHVIPEGRSFPDTPIARSESETE